MISKDTFQTQMHRALKAQGLKKPERQQYIAAKWSQVQHIGLDADVLLEHEEKKAREVVKAKTEAKQKEDSKTIDYSRFSSFVGIDPGKKTGFARCDDGEISFIKTVDFWESISLININATAKSVHFVVEVPHSKNVWHKGAQNRGAIERTGVNVGMAVREAELIAEYLDKNGHSYETSHPQGKTTSEKFKAITGYEWRTNQHERDAAMLIYHLARKINKDVVKR